LAIHVKEKMSIEEEGKFFLLNWCMFTSELTFSLLAFLLLTCIPACYEYYLIGIQFLYDTGFLLCVVGLQKENHLKETHSFVVPA
jgi:hypothetical protein